MSTEKLDFLFTLFDENFCQMLYVNILLCKEKSSQIFADGWSVLISLRIFVKIWLSRDRIFKTNLS